MKIPDRYFARAEELHQFFEQSPSLDFNRTGKILFLLDTYMAKSPNPSIDGFMVTLADTMAEMGKGI